MAPKRKTSTTALGASFYQLGPAASASKRRLYLDPDANATEEHRYADSSLTNISLDTSSGYRTPNNGSSDYSATTPITQLDRTFSATHVSSRRPSVQMTDVPVSKVPPPSAIHTRPRTYLVVGASRGIGLEFTRQLLTQSHQVIAVVRNPESASQLWQMTGQLTLRPGSCIIEQCDVSQSADIDSFATRMRLLIEQGGSIDKIILNAGILEYEKGLGALKIDFDDLDLHLRVNCIGNIVLARKLIMLNELECLQQLRRLQPSLRLSSDEERSGVVGRQVIFMSSDSGSMTDFREYEDGFAAYGASKAALNMMLRHMAIELKRRAENKGKDTKTEPINTSNEVETAWEDQICVLAMHPGEVSTDMANVELGWDVEGVITAEESVREMLRVLDRLKSSDSGTFWRWDGKQHPW